MSKWYFVWQYEYGRLPLHIYIEAPPNISSRNTSQTTWSRGMYRVSSSRATASDCISVVNCMKIIGFIRNRTITIYFWLTTKNTFLILQDPSSTEIVGGPRPQKNVSHHSWPTEKILGFKCAKRTQMALKLLRFSFLNMFRIFLVRQNNFCGSCSFYKGIFFIKIQKFKEGSVQNETMYILYKLLYQIIFWKY